MENQTEQINRLLLLWLDLQQALRGKGPGSRTPWESGDPRVRNLWGRITDPGNASALEEWLMQVAPGELEDWSQRALLESRRRRAATRGCAGREDR